MHKKQIVRSAALVLCLMFTLLTCSTTALAFELIDTDKLVSLTLSVAENDPANPGQANVLSGISFDLYRIATVDKNANYALTEKFAECGVDVAALTDASAMSDAAGVLQAYISEKGIQSDLNAISGENGQLSFKEMRQGLFLVLGTTTEVEGYIYTFSPVMVALPVLENGAWAYEQKCDLKLTRTMRTIKLMVLKAWANERGDLKKRPDEIHVDLLCNGQVLTTVALNRDNGWRYQFTDLNAYYTYTVKEHSFGTDYKVTYGEMTYDVDGNAHIIITNTFRRPGEEIPQTGLLWWPVPVLALSGMVLFAAGWIINRKEGQQ